MRQKQGRRDVTETVTYSNITSVSEMSLASTVSSQDVGVQVRSRSGRKQKLDSMTSQTDSMMSFDDDVTNTLDNSFDSETSDAYSLTSTQAPSVMSLASSMADGRPVRKSTTQYRIERSRQKYNKRGNRSSSSMSADPEMSQVRYVTS